MGIDLRNFISEDDIEQAILQKLEADPLCYDIVRCDASPDKREVLPDGTATNPENESEIQSVEMLARDLMEQLPEREAKVITGIFGINQEAPQTLREVGESMNISHERVRQLRDQALRRIRKYNSKEFLQDKKEAFLAAINK